MQRRDRIQLVLFALSSLAYFPFSHWVATTPIGTTLFLWGQMFYGLALVVTLVALPVLLVRLCFRRARRASAFLLIVSGLYISCCMGGIILGHRTRMAGMHAFAERSQPLIDAIGSYERDHSVPPRSLQDLVPDYLPIVPSTGMMAYPTYRYHTGANANEEHAGNPWALSVFTPSGGINFDQMLYFPRQNYPDRGYGGSLGRVGSWAYVHE